MVLWPSSTVVGSVRTLLGWVVLLVSGLAAYWAGRIAWADHLSRSADLADRERAVRLLSTATSYERLAEKREESGGDPLPDLKQATALDPQNAARRIRLGPQAELAGDLRLAERSLLEAAALSRLYLPRYSLAQYYFRRQNADSFWRWSRAAFQSAYGDVSPLLELGWRMRPDGAWQAQQALAERPEIARQYVMLLLGHQQTDPARTLASRIAEAAKPADLQCLLAYCNLGLSQGDGQGPLGVWNRVCRNGLLPYAPLDPARGRSLTNADFASAPLSAGFDWHVEGAAGFSVRFLRELRLSFDGGQPETILIAWQYIPVATGNRYRLAAELRTLDAPDTNGICWAVYDTHNKLVAAQRNAGGALTFTAPTEVLRLALMYQRPAGSPRLNGTVAITKIGLEIDR